jgi:Ca-activated chloride channel family protein
MHFENPGLFWLLIIPALLVVHYIWLEIAQRHPHLRVSTSIPWKLTGTPVMAWLRHVPFVLRLSAIVLIIIALARPRSSEELVEVDTEGIDIVLAMDVSTSMLAGDLKPDRINASKEIAVKFLNQRKSDRIGIVVFAGESYTKCPMTTDKETLVNYMREVNVGGGIDDGTALGNGLATAVSRLTESDAPSKVVILLTDGVNNTGEISPQDAMDLALRFGVKVYTIGVGKEGLAKYPVQTPWGIQYQDVQVEIDEDLLKDIAQTTGGRYFRATDNTTLAEIYNEINQMETGRTTISNAISYEELFLEYVLWALAALGLELLLNWFVIRRMP